jgi:hypothetical protein
MYDWSFSFKKTQLAQLVTTPVMNTNMNINYPLTLLADRMPYMIQMTVGAPPRREFRLMGDKLLTDYEVVYIDYQYNVPEYALPHYFVQLLKYEMAWHLAVPITDQAEKSEYWRTIAEGTPGENGRGGYMRQAMNIDGQGQPTNAIQDFSLINVRY